MNTLLRVIAFTFFFCADVTVHANGHAEKHEAPAHAETAKHKSSESESASELAAGPVVAEKRETFALAGGKLTVSKDSLVQRLENSATVQLVRGDFYFDGGMDVSFKTPFAVFSCGGGDCRMLIQRSKDKVQIKNLLGSIIVRRTGDRQDYHLPTATQVTVAPVTTGGAAEMEFPQSLPWSGTVRQWAALYTGDLESFKATVEEFRIVWKQAVEAISALHLQKAGLEIAHAQRASDEAARRAASIENEDAKLRQLFREKNGF